MTGNGSFRCGRSRPTEQKGKQMNRERISNGEDYGHATALLRTLERGAEVAPEHYAGKVEQETAVLESHDFKCRVCGATMRVTRDVWPKESACEHSFPWRCGV